MAYAKKTPPMKSKAKKKKMTKGNPFAMKKKGK